MIRFFKAQWKIILLILIFLALLFLPFKSAAETLFCTASTLNGRAEPSKKARVEAQFSYGDEMEVVGYTDNWIEVVGGETGTVFVSAKYCASSLEKVKYQNTSGGRVIIRESPEGKKKNDWIKVNKKVTVSAEVDGWGYIADRGWIDLSYFNEVE